MKRTKKRIAFNEVFLDDRIINNCAIDIEDGVVTDFFQLTGELPFTEWLGGSATIARDVKGLLRVYVKGKLIE